MVSIAPLSGPPSRLLVRVSRLGVNLSGGRLTTFIPLDTARVALSHVYAAAEQHRDASQAGVTYPRCSGLAAAPIHTVGRPAAQALRVLHHPDSVGVVVVTPSRGGGGGGPAGSPIGGGGGGQGGRTLLVALVEVQTMRGAARAPKALFPEELAAIEAALYVGLELEVTLASGVLVPTDPHREDVPVPVAVLATLPGGAPVDTALSVRWGPAGDMRSGPGGGPTTERDPGATLTDASRGTDGAGPEETAMASPWSPLGVEPSRSLPPDADGDGGPARSSPIPPRSPPVSLGSDSRLRIGERRAAFGTDLPPGLPAGSEHGTGQGSGGGIGFRAAADDGARRVRTAGEKAIKLGINLSHFPT